MCTIIHLKSVSVFHVKLSMLNALEAVYTLYLNYQTLITINRKICKVMYFPLFIIDFIKDFFFLFNGHICLYISSIMACFSYIDRCTHRPGHTVIMSCTRCRHFWAIEIFYIHKRKPILESLKAYKSF